MIVDKRYVSANTKSFRQGGKDFTGDESFDFQDFR